MYREIVVSAYPGPAEDNVSAKFLPLLNRYVDTFSPMEAAVYEELGCGSGELWFAYWDADKGELSTEAGPGSTVSITGLKGYSDDQVLRFLPALLAALDIAVNG